MTKLAMSAPVHSSTWLSGYIPDLPTPFDNSDRIDLVTFAKLCERQIDAGVRAIVAGEPITVYDGGRLKRDFTYIDDIVAGVVGCMDRPPEGELPARVLNIGNHRSEEVNTLIALLEQSLGQRAIVRDVARPAADVTETFASVDAIGSLTGFLPSTSLAEGIPRFVAWFRAWEGANR